MREASKASIDYSALIQKYGSETKAAASLGIARSTLSRRMKTKAPAPEKSTMEAMMASLVESQATIAKLLAGTVNPIVIAAAPKVEKAAKPEKPVAGGTLADPESRTLRKNGRRFILTSAQNNSFIHEDFLASLKTMAVHTGAEILISRYTYNKNAFNNGAGVTRESADIWYDAGLQEYLTSSSIRLADDLVFCAELDRLPTAVDPLSGLDSYTKDSSGVVGHPKVALKSMPVMKGQPHRFMFSTGTVTQRNYVDRLAGQKAAFHHTFAALYVEIDPDGQWFARQLVASDDGHFQDLETVYTPTGIHTERVAAIVWGDLHAEKMDPWMPGILWGAGGIRDTLRPGVQVGHDVGDFTVRNHHNADDPYFLLSCLSSGMNTVEGDFEIGGVAMCVEIA